MHKPCVATCRSVSGIYSTSSLGHDTNGVDGKILLQAIKALKAGTFHNHAPSSSPPPTHAPTANGERSHGFEIPPALCRVSSGALRETQTPRETRSTRCVQQADAEGNLCSCSRPQTLPSLQVTTTLLGLLTLGHWKGKRYASSSGGSIKVSTRTWE